MGKDAEVAILFADVVGSTRLYEIMGDHAARDMVMDCLQIMQRATEDNKGTVIKTVGDEVMSTFPTADDALNAARQMQQTIAHRNESAENGVNVQIRIGCHFGPVVVENRDIFGSAVHTANRMTSQAKARQIITTSTMVDRLSPDWQAAVRQIDIAALKGRSDEVALFEVLWQPEDATSMVPAINWETIKKDRPVRLRLKFQDREIVVDATNTSLTIGRSEENDLIIKGNLISRLHSRIELSRSKFMLVDQSTNGTFVLTSDGEQSFVRRDSMQLSGKGMIGLGRVPEESSPQVIHFACDE